MLLTPFFKPKSSLQPLSQNVNMQAQTCEHPLGEINFGSALSLLCVMQASKLQVTTEACRDRGFSTLAAKDFS